MTPRSAFNSSENIHRPQSDAIITAVINSGGKSSSAPEIQQSDHTVEYRSVSPLDNVKRSHRKVDTGMHHDRGHRNIQDPVPHLRNVPSDQDLSLCGAGMVRMQIN